MILNIVLGAFVLLCLNAAYLLGVRVLEYQTNQLYQDRVYQLMFLGHLALGLVVILPVVIFGIVHWSNTRHRRPSPTKKLGTLLLVIATLILLSGLMLVRLDGFEAIEVRDPARRDIIWWIHVVTPLLAIWCFILHRLTGPKLKWRRGAQIMGGSFGAGGSDSFSLASRPKRVQPSSQRPVMPISNRLLLGRPAVDLSRKPL